VTGAISRPAGVIGREREIAVVLALLDSEPGGPRALLVDGEAGIGKSTVWFEAVRLAEARGYRVLRARPAESEAKLSYAALADVVGPAFDEARAQLPHPQELALDRALPPDAFECVVLGSLSLASLHHIVRERLGTSPTRPVIARIAEASGGNPFSRSRSRGP
jgi:AAA ATPase domain